MTTKATGPRTLRFQALANRFVRGLLRTPLLCRLVGRRLIVIEVVGRTSGRRFAVPVAYTRTGGALLVGTPFTWGRNLRSGQRVTVRYRGRRVPMEVQVSADEAGVVAAYAEMARDNRAFASFNAIGTDRTGRPDPADLRRAWASGARAFRLTPVG